MTQKDIDNILIESLALPQNNRAEFYMSKVADYGVYAEALRIELLKAIERLIPNNGNLSELSDAIDEMKLIIASDRHLQYGKREAIQMLRGTMKTGEKILELKKLKREFARNNTVRDRDNNSVLDWFDEQIERLEYAPLENHAITPGEKKLTSKQIALISYYNKEQITRTNCKKTAQDYRRNNSGEDIYQDYTHYSSRENRINTDETAIKTKNKIKLIEDIIPLLKDCNKQKAMDELNILKGKEGEYI